MKFSSRTRILIGMILILSFGMALAIPVSAESNPTVLTFEIQGNNHVPAEKILGVISNTRMGAPLDPKLVQLDVQAIMALGYFTDVQVRTEKMLDGVKLIFEVFENPIFKEVQISGLTKVTPEELKPFFTQKPGEVFNTEIFKADLSKAIKFCQEKKGLWVQPKLPENIGISPDGIVKVEMVELKYGQIKILGLVKTKEIVVRRELTIKTGDVMDRQVLQDQIQRLMRLRIFDNIEPQLEMSQTPDSLDLILQFKEAQTGNFSFGVSYSETTSTWGGLLGYGETNLMGLGQSLNLDLNFSDASRNVQFSFLEPWLDNNHTSFGLSMWNSDYDISSTVHSWNPSDQNVYTMGLLRTGISFSLGRQFWKDTNGQLRMNFEKNTMENLWGKDDDTSKDSSPNKYITNPAHPLDFWDNSLEASLTKNKLIYQDSNFVGGGYQLSADYTVAGKYLGGEYNYNKTVLDGRWFWPLGSDFVFGTRLQGSWLNGDYPDYDDLYLGGMYRLRGYDDRRFYKTDQNAVGNTMQLIGNAYLLSNTELRYRVPGNKNFELVAFYDIGQINKPGIQTVKSDYGLGLHFNIPMLGMIRLDQAWNIDGDKRLVFSLGEMF